MILSAWARWCSLAIVFVTVAPAGAVAQTGRIEGTVVLAPSLSARKPRIRPYAEYGPGAVAARDHPDTNELVNVVIYLDSVPPAPEGSDRPEVAMLPSLEQLHERFVPHVLPVVKGSVVEFPNRDAVFHNVFSLSSVRSFDLGRYPKGESKSVRFDRAGVVQVFCHIHSDMSAVILVRSNPYFAVPGAGGRYLIDHLPPGEYRLVAWHERIRPIHRMVRVQAGQTTVADFAIPVLDAEARP